MKKFLRFSLVFSKVLFFVFCIVVAFALFGVSSYFSVEFYKFGLPEGTDEQKATIAIVMVLAIAVELIKFVLSFTFPLIRGRDEEADAKISFALFVALILSIFASLTYFLVVHETYSPAERIINVIYDVFLVPIGLDFCKTQVVFIFNCVFSILIEYFIILLPSISTLPFRPKLDNLTGRKSNFAMIGEILSTISSKPIMALHSRFVKTPEKTEELTVEVKEEPEVKNLDEEVQPIKQIEVEDNGSEEEHVKEPVKDVKEDKTLNEKYENFDTEREEKNNELYGLGNSLNGKIIDFEDEKKTEEQEVNSNKDNDEVAEEPVIPVRTPNKSNKVKRIPGSSKYTRKNLNLDTVKKYINYLQENLKDDTGKVIGYKKVADGLGITQGESMRIFNFLRDFGYLKTKERTTKFTKKDINLIDEDYNSLLDDRRVENV